MNADLMCGKCRRRWTWSGTDPMQGLYEHRRKFHPDEDIGHSPLDPPVEREPGEDDGPEPARE